MTDATTALPIEDFLVHTEWVQRLARNLLRGDEQGAEDLAQETMLVAFQNPPSTAENLRGWLNTVMRNLVHRRARTELRRSAREEEAQRRMAMRLQSATPSELVAKAEAERTMLTAVLQLDSTYRDVLLQRFYQGAKLREIAERLGVPESTVRSQLRRGLERVRQSLPGEENEWRRVCTAILCLPMPTVLVGSTAKAASTSKVMAPSGSLGVKLGSVALALAIVSGAWFGLDSLREREPLSPGGGPASTSTGTDGLTASAAGVLSQDQERPSATDLDESGEGAVEERQPVLPVTEPPPPVPLPERYIKILSRVDGNLRFDEAASRLGDGYRLMDFSVVASYESLSQLPLTEESRPAQLGLGTFRSRETIVKVAREIPDPGSEWDGVVSLRVVEPVTLYLTLGTTILDSTVLEPDQDEVVFSTTSQAISRASVPVRLRVLSEESGAPIEAPLVTRLSAMNRRISGTQQPDGGVDFKRVPAGRWILQVGPIPGQPSEFGWVKLSLILEPGDLDEPFEIRLPRARSLRGQLLDPSGQAAAGVPLQIQGLADFAFPEHVRGGINLTVTDETGAFELHGVPCGPVALLTSDRKHGHQAWFVPGSSSELQLPPLSIEVCGDFELRPQWKPLESRFVSIFRDGPEPLPVWTEWMKGGGDARKKSLPLGEYDVYVTDSGGTVLGQYSLLVEQKPQSLELN